MCLRGYEFGVLCTLGALFVAAEQNRTKWLGLSASLLAGGTAGLNPKLFPGPGQPAKSKRPDSSIKLLAVPPFSWMACKSSS